MLTMCAQSHIWLVTEKMELFFHGVGKHELEVVLRPVDYQQLAQGYMLHWS